MLTEISAEIARNGFKKIEHQAEACRLLKMDDRILEWNDEWNKRSEWCMPKKI